MDRMITIHLDHYDMPTEVAITAGRSGLDETQARRIVLLVREIRRLGVRNYRPTIRACIMIARLTKVKGAHAAADDAVFSQICKDILCMETIKVTHEGQTLVPKKVDEYIRKTCGTPLVPGNGGNGGRQRENMALASTLSKEES